MPGPARSPPHAAGEEPEGLETQNALVKVTQRAWGSMVCRKRWQFGGSDYSDTNYIQLTTATPIHPGLRSEQELF